MRPSHDKKSTDTQNQVGVKKKVALLPDRPNLTKSQIEFLHFYTSSAFLPINEICRQAGITPSQVAKWKKNSERFRAALRTEHLRTQQVINMDRKKVMHGFLEAIDMAKDMRQPGGMISGWKEVGRMCGFYEPERREIQLSVTGKEVIEELKGLSRPQLLELASRTDTVDVEEYEVVENGPT
jgi:hypothetical protein